MFYYATSISDTNVSGATILLDEFCSEELAGKLLKKNVLIKDLTGKIKNGRHYIRIAIRTGAENQSLVQLLKEEMQ